jgi:hypothetical protein
VTFCISMLMTLCLSDGHAIGVAHDPPAAVERSSPPANCALCDAKSRVSRSADLPHGTGLDQGRLRARSGVPTRGVQVSDAPPRRALRDLHPSRVRARAVAAGGRPSTDLRRRSARRSRRWISTSRPLQLVAPAFGSSRPTSARRAQTGLGTIVTRWSGRPATRGSMARRRCPSTSVPPGRPRSALGRSADHPVIGPVSGGARRTMVSSALFSSLHEQVRMLAGDVVAGGLQTSE